MFDRALRSQPFDPEADKKVCSRISYRFRYRFLSSLSILVLALFLYFHLQYSPFKSKRLLILYLDTRNDRK